MSKIKLKKELQNMSREQLLDIILNVYDARKEAREYFKFFLNPDSDALLEKYCAMIQKEVMRAKRGNRAKFRISVIKGLIKNFQSFDSGPEYVLRLISFAFMQVMRYSRILYYSNTQDNAAVKLACAMLDYADKHLMFDRAVKDIELVLSDERNSSTYLNRIVREALDQRQ